jgi:hypothetical protein
MTKRLIIGIIVVMAVFVIPVLSGIFFGFNWEVYGWWILCGAAGIAVGIDQIVIRKK